MLVNDPKIKPEPFQVLLINHKSNQEEKSRQRASLKKEEPPEGVTSTRKLKKNNMAANSIFTRFMQQKTSKDSKNIKNSNAQTHFPNQ